MTITYPYHNRSSVHVAQMKSNELLVHTQTNEAHLQNAVGNSDEEYNDLHTQTNEAHLQNAVGNSDEE